MRVANFRKSWQPALSSCAGGLPQRFEAAEIINRRRCERGHGDTNRW